MTASPRRPPVWPTDPMASWDSLETAQQIADGTVKADEVLSAAIERIATVNPSIGGLITGAEDQARETLGNRLRADDTARPLHGVPTAVKDLDEQRGIRTTFGTRASGTHVSTRTSGPVRQFLSTGVISVGKSAAPEYGMNPSGEPLGFPPTRNPWNTAHTAGGSSSGAAALVASGALPIAYAADGGGSIRIPAAACGLVGLKPTYGRLVETEQMRGLPVKLVTYGVVTRTVRDTAAFMRAAQLSKSPKGMPALQPDGESATPTRLRIAMVTTSPVSTVAPEVVRATERMGQQLASMGHEVEPIPVPFTTQLADDFVLYWGMLAQGLAVAGYTEVGRSFEPRLLDPWTKGLAANFRANLHRMPFVLRRLRDARREWDNLMSRFHILMTPTLGTLPPRLGHLSVENPFEEQRRRVEEFVPFTPAFNVTGAPAVSLPMALSESGLPIGIQFGAAWGEDQLLLDLAAQVEAEVGFNVRV